MSYETELKKQALRLRSIWGNLMHRTWHMAREVRGVVKTLQEDFEVSRTVIVKDLAKIIGGVSPDTLDKYCTVVSELYDRKMKNVVEDPATGFTQVRVILDSGLEDKATSALVQKCYSNDSRKGQKPYSVDYVKTMVQEAGGTAPRSKKSIRPHKRPRDGAAALARELDRIELSPATEGFANMMQFKAARQLVDLMRKADQGALFNK